MSATPALVGFAHVIDPRTLSDEVPARDKVIVKVWRSFGPSFAVCHSATSALALSS